MLEIKRSKLKELAIRFEGNDSINSQNNVLIKIAVARCARLSYMTFDGEIDYAKDIALHDQLLNSKHMSPFEHCARAMSDYEFEAFQRKYPTSVGAGIQSRFPQDHGWCENFKGFINYRYLIEKEYERTKKGN